MMDRSDAEYEAGKLLYCTTSGDRVRSLYTDVLARLPDGFEPPDVVVLADASTAFPVAFPHRCVPNKRFPEMCDGLKDKKSPWILLLEGVLCRRPKDQVTGVIAHELAHHYLKHHSGKEWRGGKLKVDNEKAADEQAEKWGFVKEIRAVREYEKKRDPARVRSPRLSLRER